jgi:hypothetical protein
VKCWSQVHLHGLGDKAEGEALAEHARSCVCDPVVPPSICEAVFVLLGPTVQDIVAQITAQRVHTHFSLQGVVSASAVQNVGFSRSVQGVLAFEAPHVIE